MGLFNKKKREFPPLYSGDETQTVNFNTVVEYLEGLGRYDYEKIIKVVNIYRNASKNVAKVLGVKDEPTTSIPSKEAEPKSDDPIDFLLDDEPVSKPKTIKVKSPK